MAMRRELPADRARGMNEMLAARVLAFPRIADARTVYLYASVRGEADTWGLLEHFLSAGIRAALPPRVQVIAVVKADAYGHGATHVARRLETAGADMFAVAILEEALALREAGVTRPILVLGGLCAGDEREAVRAGISPAVFAIDALDRLESAACAENLPALAHLKVDTGFHRLGIYDEEELYQMYSLPGLEVEGIFSHLALTSEEEDEKQYSLFTDMIEKLERRGCKFRYKHIADSISLVDYPQYRMNMVRPGALIYGLKGFSKGHLDVKTCMTFESRISQIHHVKKGEGVGYDYLWRAPEDTVIGTLPFGYSDGYPRNMRDKGYVTIRGVKCPIIGVICMDQCMVDLSGVPDAQEGDTAVIYGDGENNTMTIAEAADLAGTNKNEIVARIMARPPRIYQE